MEQLTNLTLALSPFIVAGVQALKKSGVPTVFLPVASILVGALLNVAFFDLSILGALEGAAVGTVTTYGVSFLKDLFPKE